GAAPSRRRSWWRRESVISNQLPVISRALDGWSLVTGRRARLFQRMRRREGFNLHAGVDHARERRIGLEIDLEEARARRLARQTDVRDGRLLAAAEAAGHAVVR